MTAAKPMREQMPETAAFIDACRDAFGVETINDSIRLGMQGYPNWFSATEGGREIGARFTETGKAITSDRMVIRGKAK